MTTPNQQPNPEITTAVQRLRRAELVAFPTETVYGLGADALNTAAVDRVYEAKGRPSNNPLIVHVSDTAMAARVVAKWTDEAGKLAKAFWPGPLSIILPKAANLPARVTAGSPNVAVRCPDHPLTLELLRAFDGPLVGPSANRSGRVSPTTAAHVREILTEQEVFVLDGGPCRGGIESTVVSLVGEARVLRPGLVSPEQIEMVLGRRVAVGAEANVTGPMPSPGMSSSHYAPMARAVLADARGLSSVLAGLTGRAVVVSHMDVAVMPPHSVIRLPVDALGYASGLYAALLEADARNPTTIVVVRPPEGTDDRSRAVWRAVMDRLTRATR